MTIVNSTSTGHLLGLAHRQTLYPKPIGRQAKACQAVESKERAQEERQAVDICASRPRQAAAVEAGLAKECQLASRPRQAAAVEAVEAGLEAKEC